MYLSLFSVKLTLCGITFPTNIPGKVIYLFMSSYLIYYTLFTDGEMYCISAVEAYRITKLLSFQNRKEDDDQKLAFGERATLLIYLC